MLKELSLHVLDIAQNSVTAGASLIRIAVREMDDQEKLTIEISDNGKGMTPEQVRNVTDPFFTTRTTRKVGLGIPFFKMAAEITGGSFSIQSKPMQGTQVLAEFLTSSIDCMPMGDIHSTLTALIECNPQIDFVFTQQKNNHQFCLDTREIRKMLGGEVALNAPEVMAWITDFLHENIQNINGGANQI